MKTTAFRALPAALVLGVIAACGFAHSPLSLVSGLPAVLRVGLGDHIRCAVLGIPKPGAPNPNDAIEPLDDETRRLVEKIQPALPETYRFAAAHHCRFEGRRVIHIVLKASSGPVSLVIVGRKPGESLDDMPRDPFVRASVDPYELAAFSTRNHLVFLVSQEGRSRHESLLAALRLPIRTFLEDLERSAWHVPMAAGIVA